MLTDLEPVNRESTAALIARQLRDAIMTGALAPGSQLGETELAARFQVSRGPLREAMQRLVSEGLLRSERHRGLFVIDLEGEDIHDIYSARWAIEREAAIRLVRNPERHAVIDRLSKTIKAMHKAGEQADPTALIEADLQFHELLIEGSGSRRLMRMASTLLIETRMCLAALQDTYAKHALGAADRAAEHLRIISALRGGDEKNSLRLLQLHMDDAVARLTDKPHKTRER